MTRFKTTGKWHKNYAHKVNQMRSVNRILNFLTHLLLELYWVDLSQQAHPHEITLIQ